MELNEIITGMEEQGERWRFHFEHGKLVFERKNEEANHFTRISINGYEGEACGIISARRLAAALNNVRKAKIHCTDGMMHIATSRRATKISFEEDNDDADPLIEQLNRAKKDYKGRLLVEQKLLRDEVVNILSVSRFDVVPVVVNSTEGRLWLNYAGPDGCSMCCSVPAKGLVVQETRVDARLLFELLRFPGELKVRLRDGYPLFLTASSGAFLVECFLAPLLPEE